MSDITPFIQNGALGLLTFVLWWVGKRIVDRMDARFDALEKKVEEERASNVKLGKIMLLTVLKIKNPTLDVSDEAKEFLHDDNENK